jgi:restriction endonuclease S subunit
MGKWQFVALKGHIQEVSIRKGERPAEILSVTNTSGFVRSLDVFDKQVFSEDARNYKLVRFNELAYNPSRINVGSVERCDLPEGGAVSPMYTVVRCHDTLLPQYLLYFLKSEIGRRHILHRCVGAVRFMLRFHDLEQIELVMPPISEQERLVGILDEAVRMRDLRNEADARSMALIPSLFAEMFSSTEPVEKRRLGDVCEFITKGTTPEASAIRDSSDGRDIPFLKVLHITDDGSIDFAKAPSFVSRELHKGLLRRSRVFPGDVLMNIVGPPLGRIALVPNDFEEWNVNQAIAIFRPKSAMLPIYLLHALRSPALLPSIIEKAAGVRQLNLSLEQCRDIEVAIPPLPKQNEFASYVNEFGELQKKQTSSGRSLDGVLQSLLYQAFQGEL